MDVSAPFKRYIVFVIPMYYPGGGLADIRSSHDDLFEARDAAIQAAGLEEWEVVDRDTWLVVRRAHECDTCRLIAQGKTPGCLRHNPPLYGHAR